MGLALGPLSGPALPPWDLPTPPFWEAYTMALERSGPAFLIGGVMGGLTYWAVTRPRVRSSPGTIP